MNDNLTIAVIGCGAIGGVVSGLMIRAGYNVHIVDQSPNLTAAVASDGITITTSGEHFTVSAEIHGSIEELTYQPDIILLATKAYDAIDAAQQLNRIIKPDSSVVCMQNGMVENKISEIIGIERTIGCTVGWGATMHAPGVCEQTSQGNFVIGTLNGETTTRINQIANCLASIAPCTITDNITGHTYSKLIINSYITTLGAITGLKLGEMLKIKKFRRSFITIIDEAIATAQAANLYVPPYAGKLDYYTFLKGNSVLSNMKRHLILRIMGHKHRRLKSSSLQSLERGEKTEVDYFNGYICEKGQMHGIQTPFNSDLVRMIKEIEEGKRKITPENLNELFSVTPDKN